MTEYRTQPSRTVNLGSAPPEIIWTVVQGDTASFRVFVYDDEKNAIDLTDWNFAVDFYRPETEETILSITPEITEEDETGSFTVFLGASESDQLETDDEFDIQISNESVVWTVGIGKMVMIGDITI
jgi:hypothetical protein